MMVPFRWPAPNVGGGRAGGLLPAARTRSSPGMNRDRRADDGTRPVRRYVLCVRSAWRAVGAAITLQVLRSLEAPAGLELMFPLFVGGYSLAAHSRPRRALAGLAIMIPGAVTYVLASHGIATRHILFIPHAAAATGQSQNASLFFVGEILACWLLGVIVRARTDAAELAARNAALERQAQPAAGAERGRIARELHDIVAPHLSVVVLQAARGRASGPPAAGALQQVQRRGRA